MARRRKDDNLVGLIAQFLGLVVLLSLVSPQVRQMISTVGFVAICLLGLAIVGLIVFGINRYATRAQGAQEVECNEDPVVLRTSVPRQENSPQKSLELIEQLRTIDWFQFEKLVGLVYRKLGYSV